MRVVYMGTPEFAVPALISLSKNFEVVGVYSQPDRPVGRGLKLEASAVKKKALDLGIPVFQPKSLKTEEAFQELQKLNPDVIVVAAYGQILKKNVLELPKFGCVNIHGSLLPRWRGAAPVQWAILSGDSETGICTMKMNEGLDTGDIFEISKTPIVASDTGETLTSKLSLVGAELIVSTLQKLKKNEIQSIAQSTLETSCPATYAKKLEKEMQWVSPKKDAVTLDRQIRALHPWPGSRFKLKSGEAYKIKKFALRQDMQATPGQLYERAGMLLIATQSGSIQLLGVQPDGKKEQNPAEFMNGLRGRGVSLPLEVEC